MSRRPKSYNRLLTDLRSLGMGVLGTHFISGTLKTCSSTSPEVRAALHEMGHVTRSWGKTRSNHFNHAVLTNDAGWISVDPTFMQFYCRYQLDEEEEEDVEALVPMLMHFRDIVDDPLNAFEIEQLPDSTQGKVPKQVHPSPYAPVGWFWKYELGRVQP